MYEIWIDTPEIPTMKAFESPTGQSVLDNWRAMLTSKRSPGSHAELKWVDSDGELILGSKDW